eukprot:12648421-Heterocapsa_arctica.AAC.1
MAALLGQDAEVGIEQMIWVISETKRDDFGDTVNDNQWAEGVVALHNKAVVTIEGVEVFVERIPAKEKKEWKLKRL